MDISVKFILGSKIDNDINNILNENKIEEAISLLALRINERFVESSLAKTTNDLNTFLIENRKSIIWISSPSYLIRSIASLLIITSLISIFYSFKYVKFDIGNNFLELTTLAESSINNLLLIIAAVYFVFTIEIKIKRVRALNLLNQLRGFVHVTDMHQLTKDPQYYRSILPNTKSSPLRELNFEQMGRYLNYCTELLSLTAKIAALYSQKIPDEVVARATSDIENLCSQMIIKIRQKIIILENMELE